MKNSKVSIDAMKQTAWKNKKWLGYILFTILLTTGLLYYCFPSDAFRNYLQATAERINPKYLLSVGKVSPTFPPGFSLRKTKLSLKTNPDASLFMADSLVIRPEIWSFLKGRSGYRFKCLAYGGDLNGYVHFSGNSIKSPFSASLKVNDVSIDNYTAVLSVAGRNIKGTISGTIKYSGECDLLIDGTGEAEFAISDGRVALLQPILSFESIGFDAIRVKIVLKNKKVDVTHVELKGQEVKGSLSGTITLKKEFSKSRISLRGAIELLAGPLKGSKGSGNNKFDFIVGGTFISPRFRFI